MGKAPRPLRPEAELLILLIGTRRRRTEAAARIRELAGRVDFEQLAKLGMRQRLLELVGMRLEEVEGQRPPERFRACVQESVQTTRLRATLLEHVTLELVNWLRSHGIRSAVLKGPSLGARLFGDPGLRPSTDVDLLVAPDDFEHALRALARRGYEHVRVDNWIGPLPLFETSLRGQEKEWLPPIDLHWRVHWHERDFSLGLLRRAPQGRNGLPLPQPVDEFAAMLLMYGRDGLLGARGAADAAGWWDAHEPSGEAPLLDDLVRSHPKLRRTIVAAAEVLDELVGIPAARVVSAPRRRTARSSLPARVQDHSMERDRRKQEAAVMLVDWLLTPREDRSDFVRRHLFLPLPAVAEAYGRDPTTGWRGRLLQWRYAAVMLARQAPGWASVLWAVRGRRHAGRSPLVES